MTTIEKQAWLERRRSGITATDMTAIMAFYDSTNTIKSYRTVHDVFRDKCFPEMDEEIDSVRFDVGHALEPVAAARYEKETGAKLVPAGDFGELPFRCPTNDLLLATPDYFAVDENGQIVKIVECKSVNAQLAHEWGASWSDDLPTGYVIQGHHQLVVGAPEAQELTLCDFSAIIGNDTHKCFQIRRDDELAAICTTHAQQFWNDFIIPRIPPPPDGSQAALSLRKDLYPQTTGEVRVATPEVARLIDLFDNYRTAEKEAKTEKDRLKALLQDSMEGAAILEAPGFKVTWKNDRDSEKLDAKKLLVILKERGHEALIAEATVPKAGIRRFTVRVVKEK